MSFPFQRNVLRLLVPAALGVLFTAESAWAQKCGKSGGMTGTSTQSGMRQPGRQTPFSQTPFLQTPIQQTGLTNPMARTTPAQLQNLLQQQQVQFVAMLQQNAQAQALLQQRVLQLQSMLQQIMLGQSGLYQQYAQQTGNVIRQQLTDTKAILKQAQSDAASSGE
ncbi:MAG: hypothetical protein HY040_04420 [Planctomycetes bacterium]|nr:hypothetical protein [Planctomycetota bacterium]